MLLGAGLQGLVFGVVKAAVDRAGARGFNAITDDDPVELPCRSPSVERPTPSHRIRLSWLPERRLHAIRRTTSRIEPNPPP